MSEEDDRRQPDALDGVPAPEFAPAVVGHDAAQSAVEEMLRQNRMPGAILLHGPQGIGKATLAFALARKILAVTGDEDEHRVGEQVRAGAHPNLFVLRRQPKEPKGFYTIIRVDDVRGLRDSLRMTRGRAGHRVAILDSMDDCNPSAANAMLKTLEEPPAETTFFLISHRPGMLLPTIRSRCHSVALRPIGEADVGAVLSTVDPTLSPDDIRNAVSLAGGRPRRAFEALGLLGEGVVADLRTWLQNPGAAPSAVHLAISAALAADASGAAMSFARDMLTDWMAGEARAAAIGGERLRLASANELWEKAQASFADADSLNLDPRQTLVVVFDAIRKHVRAGAPVPSDFR